MAWWSSQLTLTPGYVASKRAIVSSMYWSKVGDRKNVQKPISAFASTPSMTASAGSTGRAVGLAGASETAADASGEPLGAVDAGALRGAALGDVVAVPQAATARIAASARAKVRFVVHHSSSVLLS